MNEAAIGVMENYSSLTPRIRHVHASGKKYFKDVGREKFKSGAYGCKIIPYIEDMPLYLGAADIIITRCGAVTLSEIALVGVAAILVPSPNVVGNHQYKNAKHLENSGAALLITEEELSRESLEAAVRTLAENPKSRSQLAKKIKEFATPSARERIVDVIEEILKEKKD